MSKPGSYRHLLVVLLLMIFVPFVGAAQDKDSTKGYIPVDSLNKKAGPAAAPNKIDSVMRVHSPRKAAIRSAILPGWGQIYNKKYWKLPIVYGALAVSGAVFVYNVTNYRDLRYAYKAKYQASQGDTSLLAGIKPFLVPLDIGALRSYRDEFRRNVDYSVLAFIGLWGLNVVDAVVDAHLKTFDVSPDLSFRVRPGISELGGTAGISLVLAFK